MSEAKQEPAFKTKDSVIICGYLLHALESRIMHDECLLSALFFSLLRRFEL